MHLPKLDCNFDNIGYVNLIVCSLVDAWSKMGLLVPALLSCNGDSSLPEALDQFCPRFEEQNVTVVRKATFLMTRSSMSVHLWSKENSAQSQPAESW